MTFEHAFEDPMIQQFFARQGLPILGPRRLRDCFPRAWVRGHFTGASTRSLNSSICLCRQTKTGQRRVQRIDRVGRVSHIP